MSPLRRRLALGAAGVAAGATLAHLGPGLVCWRWARCPVAPRLSGVGRGDHVALTFDDGPDPASTPAFLDALDRLGWQATFFLLGSQVARHPELAVEIPRRGHEVAVHGYHHRNHLVRSAGWTTRDVQAGRDVIAEASGTTPRWFRPPYGALAASSLVAARRCHLQTVLWTCWGRDWEAGATPEGIAGLVEARRHRGATVLLHDSDVTSTPGSWRATLGALDVLAERWAGQGLVVGTLSDHGVAPPRAS